MRKIFKGNLPNLVSTRCLHYQPWTCELSPAQNAWNSPLAPDSRSVSNNEKYIQTGTLLKAVMRMYFSTLHMPGVSGKWQDAQNLRHLLRHSCPPNQGTWRVLGNGVHCRIGWARKCILLLSPRRDIQEISQKVEVFCWPHAIGHLPFDRYYQWDYWKTTPFLSNLFPRIHIGSLQ